MDDVVVLMARLSVTYGGQQGDLPDLVAFDLPDDEVRRIVGESLVQGIPGIDPVPDPDVEFFQVDRFPPRPDVPLARLSVRPKTPFGCTR